MTQGRRFILQAIDPDHGSPVIEAMFVAERPAELRALLGDAAKDDPELEMHYTLEPPEVAAISRHFDVPFDPGERETCLYRASQSREFPYLLHGGYELALMLEGKKPFARMGADHYPPLRHWNEDRFDRHVARGFLHKEVELDKFDEPLRLKDGRVFEGLRTVYYTLKGEEWRIPAWRLVSKATGGQGWNDTLERLEGMLLGYAPWQSDWLFERRRQEKQEFGTSLVYVAVTTSELAEIEHSGNRALPRVETGFAFLSAFEETADDGERQQLLEQPGTAALIRFRVKALAFLQLVGNGKERLDRLPVERIKDLNRLILGEIEIVSRGAA